MVLHALEVGTRIVLLNIISESRGFVSMDKRLDIGIVMPDRNG